MRNFQPRRSEPIKFGSLKDEPLTRWQAMLREAFASTTFFHIAPALSGRLKTIIGKIQEFGFEGIIAKDRHPTGF